jgi:hypothetical protein
MGHADGYLLLRIVDGKIKDTKHFYITTVIEAYSQIQLVIKGRKPWPKQPVSEP